ncbi:hypothetical protein AB0I28_19735 [Phytomonospora sp. NPDC050363]|uniref:hypothetical protein n=1 Tax=Phytomonospora sp. NPDC050363 TaxID=3155642 RepID=UPI0033E7E6BE
MFEVSTKDKRQRVDDAGEALALVELLIERTADDDVPALVEISSHRDATRPVLTVGRAGAYAVAWHDRTYRAVSTMGEAAETPATFIAPDGQFIWQTAGDVTLTPKRLVDLVDAYLSEPGGFRPDIAGIDWEESPPVQGRAPVWLPPLNQPDATAPALRLLAARAAGLATALTGFGDPVSEAAVPMLDDLRALLDHHAAHIEQRSPAHRSLLRPAVLLALLFPVGTGTALMIIGQLPWWPGLLITCAGAGAAGLLALLAHIDQPTMTIAPIVPALPTSTTDASVRSLRTMAGIYARKLSDLLTDLADLQERASSGMPELAHALDAPLTPLMPIPGRLTSWADRL